MKNVRPILKNFATHFAAILLGFGSLGWLALVVSHYAKSDFVASADEFFVAVQQDNLETAYGYLSDDFQDIVSKAELDNYLDEMSIPDVNGTSWGVLITYRGEGDGKSGLRGKITTESGDVVPVEVSFVNVGDELKIFALRKVSPQSIELILLGKILMWSASIAALMTVLLFSLTARHVAIADRFLMAVQQNDLDVAYGYLSKEFQATTNKAELTESLHKLLPANFEEVIWKTRNLQGNQCSLLGTIITKSKSTTDFWLGFIKEKGGWKITVIEVPLAKQPGG